MVVLDTKITPELRAECLRQEAVVAIQAARKALNLKYEQRIETTIAPENAEVAAAVEADPEYVKAQTLSDSLEVVAADSIGAEARKSKVEGEDFLVRVKPKE